MRAYQTIRFIEHPDVADIQAQGRKSRIGRLPGTERGYVKPEQKARVRRMLKRRDRHNVDQLMKHDEEM